MSHGRPYMPGCVLCAEERAGRRIFAGMGVVLVAVLALFAAGTARADQPDARVATPVAMQLGVQLPDGGTEDVPAPIHAGQVAPVDGVLLTVSEAAKRAAERADLRTQNAELAANLTKADAIPGYVWLLSCVGGVMAAGYCTAHDCNPFHIGRK